MGASLIVAVIMQLAQTALTVLTKQNVLSPQLSDLIGVLTESGASLFQTLRSGGTVSDEIKSILSQVQTALTAAKQDTSVAPEVIDQIVEAERVIQAAINGYEAAQQNTDPSTLTPIDPVE